MSSISLVLHKELHCNYGMYMPGVGATTASHEIITAIEPTDGPTLPFRYFRPEQDHDTNLQPLQLQPQIITMPSEMGKRVLAFCEATFVEGQDNFNCFSFVDFVMGWHSEIGQPGPYRYFDSVPVGPDTSPNEPYFIHAPHGYGGPIPHLLLGAARRRHALNVLGPDMPLAISKNTDLLRAFGGINIRAITKFIPADQYEQNS